MKNTSLLVAGLAVVALSIDLPCGLSGMATSQAATGQTVADSATLLPNVTVDAPKQVNRTSRSTVPHRTLFRRTPQTAQTPSAAPGSVSAKDSVSAKLAKLASATSSCAGGCQSSFRSGNEPWHGCSGSSGTFSFTCRNVGNYKTFAECQEAGLLTGWRPPEISWYCTSLALK